MQCRFASLVLFGAVCLQHACVNAVRVITKDAEAPKSKQLKMLQWNPHWQCADDIHCHAEVNKSLVGLLSKGDLDFANVVELDGPGDSFTPPSPYLQINSNCTKDQTALFYNSQHWQTIDSPVLGCMAGGDDRPYIVQAFKSLTSNLKVTVVGAHFPHPAEAPYDGLPLLKDAVSSVANKTDVNNLLLAADTNLFGQTLPIEILERFKEYLPPSLIFPVNNTELWKDVTGKTETFIATALELTCCLNPPGFSYPFDRIISNFGTDMQTEVLFNEVPKWAYAHNSEFHKAIIGSFTIDNV